MSMVQFKKGVKFVCDICGFSDDNLSRFNDYDCDTKQHYCLKCHPLRMSFRQLIEWLAKGQGILCQQGKDYTTAPAFIMSPVIINGKRYAGKFDNQIPYDEHELVVSEFKDGFSNWKIPTYEMYKQDCKEAYDGND